jgi:hypothetical protein
MSNAVRATEPVSAHAVDGDVTAFVCGPPDGYVDNAPMVDVPDVQSHNSGQNTFPKKSWNLRAAVALSAVGIGDSNATMSLTVNVGIAGGPAGQNVVRS